MFPKLIYESLPYAYMSIGVVEINYFETILATMSGVLFFFAGALVWVMRSNARRTDPEKTRKHKESGQFFYELKPFLLIFLGVMVLAYVNNWLVYPLAGIVCLFGVYIMLIRNMHRQKRIKLRNS
ncbi:hypothetical protein J1N51_14140 [Psychrosphaera ytuae]|uniref:Uncharacterized protein n=1 Tax=Psychrosphaera ytuae TaxID=2820710 RepID=A0A975DB16_9GAMM|nr:hypothetical protein [Psychrosphaera ytuae]QTH63831.1 hypothetical protein J1N51_14140 [Psychrosphaera ytuae]